MAKPLGHQRISLVTLATRDMAASRAYYTALGWEIAEAPTGKVTFFRLKGQYMGLYDADMLEADLGRPVALPASGAVTLATNWRSEEEVDAAVDAALAAGARLAVPAGRTPWGGYSAIVEAPDGHLWEFAQNPFWPLDEEGHIAGEEG